MARRVRLALGSQWVSPVQVSLARVLAGRQFEVQASQVLGCSCSERECLGPALKEERASRERALFAVDLLLEQVLLEQVLLEPAKVWLVQRPESCPLRLQNGRQSD